MPPWHIDRSVGVQKFKNDMSLTRRAGGHDRHVGRSGRRARQSRRHAGATAGRRLSLLAGRARRLRTARHRREVRRTDDARRASGRMVAPAGRHSGSPEPRWVRMVEIRPSNLAGRKILHHSIAYQVLESRQRRRGQHRHRPAASARRCAAANVDDRVNRRPQLMEWAIGKGYDRYPDGTRQTHPAGREDRVGRAHPRGGRRDHRRLRARHLALSERSGAEEAQLPVGFTGLKNGPARSISRRIRCRTPKASRCCGRTR